MDSQNNLSDYERKQSLIRKAQDLLKEANQISISDNRKVKLNSSGDHMENPIMYSLEWREDEYKYGMI